MSFPLQTMVPRNSDIGDHVLSGKPLRNEEKRLIVKAMLAAPEESPDDLGASYLKRFECWYQEACKSETLRQIQLAAFLKLCKHIRESGNSTRSQLKTHLTNTSESTELERQVESRDLLINLAVRATTMICIVTHSQSESVELETPLRWKEEGLRDLLRSKFEPSQIESKVKLGKHFNAYEITRLTNLETIFWTDNLIDHLRISNHETSVAIFHHASFLKANSDNPLFPKGFIKETIQTLSLLLPKNNKEVGKWYRKIQPRECLDPEALNCKGIMVGNRKIDSFHFWKERLSDLKELFDDSEPQTVSQLWLDPRHRVAWISFWVVVVLTVLFGLIQSIEGGIQSYWTQKQAAQNDQR